MAVPEIDENLQMMWGINFAFYNNLIFNLPVYPFLFLLLPS